MPSSTTPSARPHLAGRRFLIAAVLATGTLFGQSGPSGNSPDAIALLQSISVELRTLHRELMEDRREFQQRKVQDLEGELGTIQEQQRQIQAEQSSRVQQAADIEAQLQQSSLAKTERDELEAQRTELLNAPSTRFNTAQTALSQREAQLRDRLALQQQHMQAIEQELRQLSVGAP